MAELLYRTFKIPGFPKVSILGTEGLASEFYAQNEHIK